MQEESNVSFFLQDFIRLRDFRTIPFNLSIASDLKLSIFFFQRNYIYINLIAKCVSKHFTPCGHFVCYKCILRCVYCNASSRACPVNADIAAKACWLIEIYFGERNTHTLYIK